jgi:hypothetical protein
MWEFVVCAAGAVLTGGVDVERAAMQRAAYVPYDPANGMPLFAPRPRPQPHRLNCVNCGAPREGGHACGWCLTKYRG